MPFMIPSFSPAHLHRLEEGILRLSYLFDAKFKLMPEVIKWLEQHDCMVRLQCVHTLYARIIILTLLVHLLPSTMHLALSRRATPVCCS